MYGKRIGENLQILSVGWMGSVECELMNRPPTESLAYCVMEMVIRWVLWFHLASAHYLELKVQVQGW